MFGAAVNLHPLSSLTSPALFFDPSSSHFKHYNSSSSSYLSDMRFFAIALAFFAGSLVHAGMSTPPCAQSYSQLTASTAPAGEIVARQVGDLQCNLDRLSIVAALAATQGTLKTLSKQLTS